MSYNFTKLSDVDLMEEFNENANVLVECDGVISKMPVNQIHTSSPDTESPIVDSEVRNSIYAFNGSKVVKIYPTYEQICNQSVMQQMVKDALFNNEPPTRNEFEHDFFANPVVLMNDYYRIFKVMGFDHTYGIVHTFSYGYEDNIDSYRNLEWTEL